MAQRSLTRITSGLRLHKITAKLKTKVHGKWIYEKGPLDVIIRNGKFNIYNDNKKQLVGMIIVAGILWFEAKDRNILRKEKLEIWFNVHCFDCILKLYNKSDYDRIYEVYEQNVMAEITAECPTESKQNQDLQIVTNSHIVNTLNQFSSDMTNAADAIREVAEKLTAAFEAIDKSTKELVGVLVQFQQNKSNR